MPLLSAEPEVRVGFKPLLLFLQFFGLSDAVPSTDWSHSRGSGVRTLVSSPFPLLPTGVRYPVQVSVRDGINAAVLGLGSLLVQEASPPESLEPVLWDLCTDVN